jgi:hypothetical protein
VADESSGPTRVERFVYVSLTAAFALVFVAMIVTMLLGNYLDHLCFTYRQC